MSEAEEKADGAIRLDKWLWHARFFKSRTLAATACRAGDIRVNSAPVDKAGRLVRPGDVVTFAAGPFVRVLRILAPGVRRGPAPEARSLYEDLAPPDPAARLPVPPPGLRAQGAGRPTKRERRSIDRFTDGA